MRQFDLIVKHLNDDNPDSDHPNPDRLDTVFEKSLTAETLEDIDILSV